MHENDMQLPYDRCVKIDQEVDTLLEEEKKKQKTVKLVLCRHLLSWSQPQHYINKENKRND